MCRNVGNYADNNTEHPQPPTPKNSTPHIAEVLRNKKKQRQTSRNNKILSKPNSFARQSAVEVETGLQE